MKVLRKSDRIKFKVEEVEFVIAPLSYRDRIELSATIKTNQGESVSNYIEQTFLMIKKCVKDVKGLCDFEGVEYRLAFTDSGELTDDCADELLNCFQNSGAVTTLVTSSLGNISAIDGAELVFLGK